MEIWDLEVESGDGTDVKIQQGTYLILTKAYIKEVKDIQEECIYLHITRDGKKALVGNINPHIQPEQNMRLLFDTDFQISHTLKNKSLHLNGVVYEKYPNMRYLSKSDDEKEDKTKKEEASSASDCAHYCRRFMKLEFWGSEIKCGELLNVKLGGGSSLHLKQASLSLQPKEAVYLEVSDGNKSYVLATFNPETLPQERIDVDFDKDIQIRHNLTNGSVYLYGMQLKKRVHNYPFLKLNHAKEEASLASECARTCNKFKTKEFWGVKIDSRQPFDVDLGPDPFYLHLTQASLIPGEMDQKTSQSVSVEVLVGGEKFELANLHTQNKPQERLRRGFEQKIQIQHNFENGSVQLLGTLTTYKKGYPFLKEEDKAKKEERKVEVASSKCAHCCKFCHRTLLSDNEDEEDAA